MRYMVSQKVIIQCTITDLRADKISAEHPFVSNYSILVETIPKIRYWLLKHVFKPKRKWEFSALAFMPAQP